MFDIILEILSIIGIILLVLLAVILVLLLLVLFFPITYRFYGNKAEDIVADFKAKWLFGFFRVYYRYPEAGTLYVKVLWHTLFQKKLPQDSGDNSENMSDPKEKPVALEKQTTSSSSLSVTESDSGVAEPIAPDKEEAGDASSDDAREISVDVSVEDKAEESQNNGFFKKIEKIKYTILNIYDKIKEIWENITYYVELLKEENTKALFQHITKRLGIILKSIRPRHMKANIVFGTGAPDTTGYLYGVYGMLSAGLGADFLVEPDFEQAVFKGEIQFSGHITIWVLLINALKLFFDPKLHLFIKKVKAGMPKKEK